MFSGHKNSDQIHLGAFHGSLVMLQITCYPDREILEGNQVFLKSLRVHSIAIWADGTKRHYGRLRKCLRTWVRPQSPGAGPFS